MNYCYKCQKTQPRENFHSDASRNDGVSRLCKACRKQYYLENKEAIVQRAQKWNLEHPEEYRAIQRRSYLRKKETSNGNS